MKKVLHLLAAVTIVFILTGMDFVVKAQVPVPSQAAATPAADPQPNTVSTDSSESPFPDVPAASAANLELQDQVQEALSKVPELSNDKLRVNAAEDGLEVSGTVANGKERQAAIRIAQSFARGKKVVDHIVVNGRNAPVESMTPDKQRVNHQANSEL